MKTSIIARSWKAGCLLGLAALGLAAGPQPSFAQIVPGSGRLITEIGDDFEDENWNWIPNLPKSSDNIDNQTRHPLGMAANSAWVESALRGQPDMLRRVPTPQGGLPGSLGALAIRTLGSGVPGRLSNEMQQDDLILNGSAKLGYSLPVEWTPSAVVRVWLPPWDQWENRTGSQFGFRADCTTTKMETKRGLFFRKRQVPETEAYWPGLFIQFHSKSDPKFAEDSAMFLLRADESGNEVPGPMIRQTGWWTLGMTFTPDGRVHYFARHGVDRLTPADYIGSQLPYGYKCEKINTIFFNVTNTDNGRNWSTEFIIDDPQVYTLRR